MRRLMRLGLAALLLVAALLVVGCGEEEGLDVAEGEPVELGELLYNVQLTRFSTRTIPRTRPTCAARRRHRPTRSTWRCS